MPSLRGCQYWKSFTRSAIIRGMDDTGRGADETLYEHAGGQDGLHRLEEIFYAKALADPILRQLFTHRVPSHVDHLTWFTAESFGGPARFTEELGFAYLIDVHRNLAITNEQRERFVAAYVESLDEAGMPDDEPFRRAVREHVEFGADVAQQNSQARTDAELHPIREVPHWDWSD
jgi:hemoglobin